MPWHAALRRMPSLDTVPIIAVTSYAMVGDRERILAAGCNGYIEKPINPETFADELAPFLGTRLEETHEDGAHRR